MRDALSHEVLHLLDRLRFNTPIKSLHHLGGRHDSRLKGSSPEFREYREHRPHDGLHQVDWKASARSRHWLVRERDHQGIVEHWLFPDTSASMDFPNDERSKFSAQQLICGALLYFLHGQGDSVGISLTQNDTLRTLPCSRSRHALDEAIGAIGGALPQGRANPTQALEKVAQVLKRPAHLWVMTDFDGEPEPWMSLLRELSEFGHQVHVLHLFHPRERDLPWTGSVIFEDLEQQVEDAQFHVDDISASYREAYVQHCDTIEAQLSELGVHHHLLSVAAAPESWMMEILVGRENAR